MFIVIVNEFFNKTKLGTRHLGNNSKESFGLEKERAGYSEVD